MVEREEFEKWERAFCLGREAYEAARAPLLERIKELETWQDGDQPLPEDDAIEACHPVTTDVHHHYTEAMRLVGAKRSKAGLVLLVNWLLCRIASLEDTVRKLSEP